MLGIVGSIELRRSESVQQRGRVFGKFRRFKRSCPGRKATQCLEAVFTAKNQRRCGEEFATEGGNYRGGESVG